jgi:MraZ protein
MWEELINKISQKASFDPQLQTFETFYVGGAHEAQVDKQGRVLVPPRLREWAHLGRDVTFSARHDHFQLWDRAALARVLAATEEQLRDPRFFEKLNL